MSFGPHLTFCPFPNTKVTDYVPLQVLEGVKYNPAGTTTPTKYNYTWAIRFCDRVPEAELYTFPEETCASIGRTGLLYGAVGNMENGKCDSAFGKQESASCEAGKCELKYQQFINGAPSAFFNFSISCDENQELMEIDGNVQDFKEDPNGTQITSRVMTARWKAACADFTGFGTPEPTSGSGASPSGAPGSDAKGIFGTVVIIIIVVGIALYVIGGIVYNKVKSAPGVHPHGQFWSSVPDYFLEGHKFVRSKLPGGNSGSKYESVHGEEGSSTV